MAERRDEDEGNFLSRWSRRKAAMRQGASVEPTPPRAAPVPAPPRAAPVPVSPAAHPFPAATARHAVPATGAGAPIGGLPVPGSAAATSGRADVEPAATPAAPAPAAPTLEDVAQLTADSDYRPFTAPHVDPAVRNAAMKKLFHSDPHFQVMDGLDVYIDDYNTPDPLPKAIMRTMLQARALGLLDDELKDQDKPGPDIPEDVSAEPEAPALASDSADTPPPHEDADLQLQPDDAAGRAAADTRADNRLDPAGDSAGDIEPQPGAG